MNICITGSSRGLGLALAKQFVKNGHTVWGLSRSAKNNAANTVFTEMNGDITDEKDLERWHDTMQKAGFEPDMVVLNASIMPSDLQAHGMDRASAKQTIETNLLGTLQTIQTFLPSMIKKGAGTFVLLSSTASIRPSQKSASYSASKAGMAIAMRSLQLHYKKKGITFKTVTLGPIATNMWEGKRNALVPSVEQAANTISDFAVNDRRTLWYPFLSTTLLRLSSWLPDDFFAFVSQKVMK